MCECSSDTKNFSVWGLASNEKVCNLWATDFTRTKFKTSFQTFSSKRTGNMHSFLDNPYIQSRRGDVIDTGMCCYFGYFWGVAPRFLGIIFGYSRIFGYHFLVKFDFFNNNPDFVVLILIFPSVTLRNVARRVLVSYFLCRNVK